MPNGNKNKPEQPASIPPTVVGQIIINLLNDKKTVTVQFPSNAQAATYMMGEALKAMGQQFVWKEPSPIIQLPAGAKLPSG